MSFAGYKKKKINQLKWTLKDAKKHKTLYLFLLPYFTVFTLFTVAPVVVSLVLSFTYYNVFEAPRFHGLTNYINLLLADDIFLTAVKNTFLLAVITGPIGYLASFMFAWFIHELPRYVRAVAVLVFYAPSIAGGAFIIWSLIFSGDSKGYLNSILVETGIMSGPILWLTDTRYMMPVVIIVVLWMSLGTGFLSFVAGLQTVDAAQYEAGYVDGIKNRWQELWYITLPNMKGMLMFGAVMAITQSFGVGDVTQQLCGMPSTDYAVHTAVNHLVDYGTLRFEMGYASAIATILFLSMFLCNKAVQSLLRRVGQ